MSISYQFGDVDAHGALIGSQAASLEAEHQSIVRDVLAAGDFWGWLGFRSLPGVHHPVGPQLPDHLRTSQQPRPKSPDRRQQHEQHRLRRRRQLGLTLHNPLWPAHPPVRGPQPFPERQSDEYGSTLERNPIRSGPDERATPIQAGFVVAVAYGGVPRRCRSASYRPVTWPMHTVRPAWPP